MSRFDQSERRAAKNRARVRKCRNLKKQKANYEKKISERINSLINDFEYDDSFEQFSDGEFLTDKTEDLKDSLRRWAVDRGIAKTHVNGLLSMLKSSGFAFLPIDSRTLLKTPVNVPIDILSNGKLCIPWYCGIGKCLEHALFGIQRNVSITLDFNSDGLPIAKSSNKQFWPILASMRGKYLLYSNV